ncbi:MOSC domain-containing protein [Alkalihalobacillus sp. AL-G]|uniref:MOSC domain-containing protein n=1 Tax=Alkalihalobacillus sp. AL-G TaxID=2926399 RepID=UPI00272DA6DB|nr:MOSC domain-containing protein [Alkalihalobacillus sp. AL-G]WLD93235.1 MOSC domain-containing protein [Alkalihalobacillus sp. AL-G]
MKAGTIEAIFRYPVKSMQGEKLEKAVTKEYGIEGDRIFAWEKQNSPGKHLTIPELPSLLSYKVRLDQNQQLSILKGSQSCSVSQLEEELSRKSGTNVNLVDIDPNGNGPAYWDSPLLITTTASLKEIEKASRRDDLDILRFRPNLIVELADNTPFQEESWIGKVITMGEVILYVKKGCERCAYVNVDPATQEIDTGVLKIVMVENKMTFGVYATVVRSGHINQSDEIHI